MDFRAGSVCLMMLLLPARLSAQATPEFPSGMTTTEPEYPAASRTNGTGSSGISPVSPQPPWSEQAPSEPAGRDWTPADAFLFSRDPSVLESGECAWAYSLTGQGGALPANFRALLRPSMDALANTANFLNMIFQASDLRESSVREDMEWYHALVRSLLEADPIIRRALLTFDADPASPVPQLLLRASRGSAPKVQIILLQDLSNAWEQMHPAAATGPAPDDSWFSSFKFPSTSQPSTPALSKRVLLNDLNTLDTPKWDQGDSYVTNRTGVRWGEAPFLECEDGRFLPGWLLTLSTSFYGLKPDLTPEFRGVIRVDVNIQDFDVDQCATGDGWFANTHQCNGTTMRCEPITGQGFQLGQYCCRCKEGYYSPPQDAQATPGESVNGSVGVGEDGGVGVCYPALPVCLPCWPGCRRCQDGAPCWVQEDWFLRASVLAVQGFFMLLVFISMLVAYQFRRSRRIRASGLLLLETILFGSLLLYFPVFILYFKPSTFRCILLRWVRMLGFAIVYGTVTLKMYRVLKVFLSRTAQRVPYMSSIHLLRMLGIMVVTVSWFLCAWTVGVLQNRDRNVPLLITSTTSDGQGFSLCDLDRWDYMMAVAELLFLCWGSFLCSAVKPVPSAFHEPRYMGIAIHNELLLSSMFHLLRFVMPSLHPDWMLLLFFTHTHVTITVTLALLFVPKFIHVSRPGREEIAAEVYEDEVDLRRSGSYLNSSFTSWSDHTLDPDDIRDELKKLYAQLEVHKTKKMTSNNPHMQKKRSSRCRSIIRRITEIPESMSRQCSREEKEFRNRSPSQASSYKRSADTISVNCSDESVPRPSPILRKSQSEHDYAKDKDSSLHDSMMRANLAKRASQRSQRSETDSLDIGPLVCKSASAHNLTVDNNLLHPDHNKLFKSLSLTSSKAHSLEDTSRAGRDGSLTGSIKDQTTSALQSQSFDKAEVCPWELEEQRPAEKTQKHVTYAPFKSADASVNLDLSVSQHICPWDHLPDPPPPADTAAGLSNKDGVDGECESPRPKVPISCSVPGSPMPNPAKEQRIFSFRSPTQKWLSVKSFIGSVDGSPKVKNKKEGSTKEKAEDSVSQKSQESGGTGTKLTNERNTQQKRSMTTGDMKPCLVKQAAYRLSSCESTERSPRKIVFVKPIVSPWDTEDTQKDGVYENVFISRQNSTQSDTSRTVRTPSANRRGGNRITPALSVSHADDSQCGGSSPRRRSSTITDIAAGMLFQRRQSSIADIVAGVLSQRKQTSAIADICPWEVQDTQVSERASMCPWELQEALTRQEKFCVDVCPWESQNVPATPNTSLCHQPSQQKTLQINRPKADVCPWETAETPKNLKRQETLHADVCPWDADESSIKVEAFYENVRPEIKVLNKAREGHKTEQINVCPWDSEHMSTDRKQDDRTKRIPPDKTTIKTSTAPQLMTGSTSSIEACPWDFPEPPQNLTDICPWAEESPAPSLIKPTTKEYTLRDTTAAKTEICPWEAGDQDRLQVKDSAYGNICPWEIDEPKTKDSGRVDICPWETGNTDDTGQQETTRADMPKKTEKTIIEDRAKNCQLTGDPEKTKGKDNVQLSVCPWEAEEPAVTARRDSTDVSKRQEMTKGHNSAREDVCPRDTEEPENVNSICPWETAGPANAGRRDSVQNVVSKLLENKKRQDGTNADVCPWEMAERETIKRQDSNLANICPWETAEPENTGRRESVQSLVSKLLENKKRQDSSNADVCPWETEEAGTKTTDVSSEPQKTTTGEISQIEVCQLETEEPARGTEEVMNTQVSRDESGEAEGAKANMPLARRDALCPWVMEGGTKPGSISDNDNASDVFTWDPDDIPEEDEEADAVCAAEAFVFPDDL